MTKIFDMTNDNLNYLDSIQNTSNTMQYDLCLNTPHTPD